jgi:hypothetical protein
MSPWEKARGAPHRTAVKVRARIRYLVMIGFLP